MPIIKSIKNYDKRFLSKDISAGLSVAAIALPVGIAYSGLIGLSPVTGLYSSILPLIAYAIFGSSKQLIVGPDSATCLLAASALSAFAVPYTPQYTSMAMLLTLTVGLLCIAAGFLKLGFIANFLSKPILTGYLNGIALSIILSQLGKFCGFNLESGGFFKMTAEFFSKLDMIHPVTFFLSFGSFAFLRLMKKRFPKIPSPLIIVVLGTAAVMILDLGAKGVAVVGNIPSGLPDISLPTLPASGMGELLVDAAGIVLISYCSAMLTNKSNAVRNGFTINPNQDFIALGASNIASGLSGGYVVSGADSRTAVNEASGGKTQLVSVVAALTLIIFILFFTKFLSWLPIAVLSAIIISSSIGLFDWKYLRKLFIVSKSEFIVAMITLLSVITIGILPAVIIAIAISLAMLIAGASKPNDAILGKLQGEENFQDITEFENCHTIKGLVVYRFEAGLLFFNADYFKDRVRNIVSKHNEKLSAFILDASSINYVDITAADAVEEIIKELEEKNIVFFVARPKHLFNKMLKKTGLISVLGANKIFDSVHKAVEYAVTFKQISS